MSYQVLARKWRPKTFETLVGQEHVVRALTHALEQRRLHHAYLFTGTRGVGKTTLSRILAKALNCVGADGQGDITAKPCGVCAPCREIDAGRFVDYIEMDAASNRGVEEMAQLLEQAIYAPSSARFKVYMIDEVHMLSSHAFNAMLKTLEEPPDYVKFILATTDPHKVPVTVLSRCLQFNLKQMPEAQIATHLAHVLEAEGIAYEAPALALLGRAAAGSMRDALSLTDQAIAYSAENLSGTAVRAMLGALDQTYLVRLLDALASADGPGLLAVADELAERSLSFEVALQDLARLVHRIAVVQTVPSALASDAVERADIERLARAFSPEEVQLFYEIATRGRKDLGLAPDEYAGFTMTLLRMLAFRPMALEVGGTDVGDAPPARRAATPAARPGAVRVAQGTAPGMPQAVREPVREPAGKTEGGAAEAMRRQPEPSAASPDAPRDASRDALTFDGNWPALAQSLQLSGLARQLAEQAELVDFDGRVFRIRVPIKSLMESGLLDKLKAALSRHFGAPVGVHAEVGAVGATTVAAIEGDARARRQAEAVAAIQSDPFVQALVKDFGATVVPGSIKPAQ